VRKLQFFSDLIENFCDFDLRDTNHNGKLYKPQTQWSYFADDYDVEYGEHFKQSIDF